MNRIITISREFGSGGRELGRRLAEALGIEYYDREILAELSKRTPYTERYLQEVEGHLTHALYPITIGKTFLRTEDYSLKQAQAVFGEQYRLLRELAEKSDCVIVGRCAEYVLHDYNPFRIFVYADMESKIRRCRERGADQLNLTDKEIKDNIRRVDKNRSKYYAYHAVQTWGDRANYDLCINTTKINIKEFAPILAQIFNG